MTDYRPLRIPAADKARLRVMFLAKHALATGEPDPADGNHAVYHHEMRRTLEEIGLNVVAADSFSAIYDKPDVDYVVTLLNRGGFLNSEMLGPLLLTRHGVPYLGASPIIRGLGDDKHLMKLVAQHRGVPVTPWTCIRRGQPVPDASTSRGIAWSSSPMPARPPGASASWTAGRLRATMRPACSSKAMTLSSSLMHRRATWSSPSSVPRAPWCCR
jgi:D-alanine-D-alanine ligase